MRSDLTGAKQPLVSRRALFIGGPLVALAAVLAARGRRSGATAARARRLPRHAARDFGPRAPRFQAALLERPGVTVAFVQGKGTRA